jgi:long-chain acyl-CoA synthetase
MVKKPEVVAKYQRLVDGYNEQFSHIEQVKKFVLVPDAWEPVKTDSTEAELTPTMKLKRRVILKKYASEIEEMYQ